MGPHRVNIINLLNLIASRSEQLEYQESAPVNVANELVNQWFDDFYHPADEQFASQFSADELALLKRFDAYYNERLALLPDSLDGLLRNRAWDEVMAYAGGVLDACEWRGIQARYESASSIINILTQFPDLEVWCERDCDQYPVMSVDTVDELLEQLQQVQEFCLHGQLECPSFSYRKRCLSADSTT